MADTDKAIDTIGFEDGESQRPGWIVLPNGAILCRGGVADIEFINCYFEGDEAHEPHTKEQHEK